MKRTQRSALADATMAAGATILLLFSTSNARGGVTLTAGILLVLLGAALLWGTPRPSLRTRMLASVAGLFLGYGFALFGTPGAYVALGAGALLLLGVWAAVGRQPVR